MSDKNAFIISLGGSLIVPGGGIDWKFLKKFRNLIIKEIKAGRKFFIVCGGGATARNYGLAAKKVVRVKPEDVDWLGIHSTRLNAHLLRTIFHDVAFPEVIKNPTFHRSTSRKVVLAGGWKPGWSTDYVATMIAQEYGIKKIVNLSNVDYVYGKDPKKHKDAEKIEKIDWPSFKKLVGSKWIPGMNAPFDPIASRKGETLGLTVAIMNGKNLPNLAAYIEGKKFKGTLIN